MYPTTYVGISNLSRNGSGFPFDVVVEHRGVSERGYDPIQVLLVVTKSW